MSLAPGPSAPLEGLVLRGLLILFVGLFAPKAVGWNCAMEFVQTYAEGVALSQANVSAPLRRLEPNAIEVLYARGVLRDDPTPVYAMKQGIPDPTQPTGFRRVFLPTAQSRFFVPDTVDLRKPEAIQGYDGYMILIPGIGTNRSEATTLFTIGQTLNSGSDSALNVEGRPRKLKLLPVLFDATLGGMGTDAPLYFGQHDTAVAAIRHLRLILAAAFPGVPCFMGGRSQGGLMAMEYAEWFADIAGVVAVNPSPTRPDLHQRALELGLASLATMMGGGLTVATSFRSYERHTPDYVAFGTHGFFHRVHRWLIRANHGHRKVPTLILGGRNDEGYPPEYLPFVEAFVAEDPEFRQLEVFDGGHDLWTRRDRQLYKAVLRRMAVFFAGRLAG